MRVVAYPSRDGYVDHLDTIYVVRHTRFEDGVRRQHIAGVFEFESEAIHLAKSIGPDACVTEEIRRQEVRVR